MLHQTLHQIESVDPGDVVTPDWRSWDTKWMMEGEVENSKVVTEDADEEIVRPWPF